jgi:hypothetical protein
MALLRLINYHADEDLVGDGLADNGLFLNVNSGKTAGCAC